MWSEKAPISPSTYSARTASACSSTRNMLPFAHPASSSATPAKMTSRVSFFPAAPRARSDMTTALMAAMFFMSTAPRPQR